MKIVFLAGPYRAASEHGVYLNIHRAGELAREVWLAGAACLSPQKNTAFMGGDVSDELWLKGAQEMLRRSDAVLAADGWGDSAGALAEVALALELGIPVFTTVDDVRVWLSGDAQCRGIGSLVRSLPSSVRAQP